MRSNLQVRPVISDGEVETIILIRKELELVKEQLERIKTELDDHEQKLIFQLDAGAANRCRWYEISIRDTERRFPAWKEHYIELAGKDAADRVLEATEPKLYRALVIKGA